MLARGFGFDLNQPEGATDYVHQVGIFHLRARVPVPGSNVEPAWWVGFTAGGPLVSRRSPVRYSSVGQLVDDMVMLRRIFAGS